MSVSVTSQISFTSGTARRWRAPCWACVVSTSGLNERPTASRRRRRTTERCWDVLWLCRAPSPRSSLSASTSTVSIPYTSGGVVATEYRPPSPVLELWTLKKRLENLPSTCRKIFVQECKIWDWKLHILVKFSEKLNFWALIIFSVENI